MGYVKRVTKVNGARVEVQEVTLAACPLGQSTDADLLDARPGQFNEFVHQLG
jgi:hypothetical protein